jgi:predicted XRE-type DNA-binding protein
MIRRTESVRTSGNVFNALGFLPGEAEHLRVRSIMMNALIGHVQKRKLTQAQAAKLLGVTQPRVSDLMRGRIDLFSIDKLVDLLAAAGLRVDLRVRKAA